MKKRNIIYVFVTLVLIVIPIMTDFVRMGATSDFFTDTSYWLGVLGVQIPVILLLFTTRENSKARERMTNEVYTGLRKTLDTAYIMINHNHKSEQFDNYVAADNRLRKLNAYKTALNGKIARLTGKITDCDNFFKRRAIRLKDRAKGQEVKERNPFYMFVSWIKANKKIRAEQKKEYFMEKLSRADEEIDYLRVKHVPISTAIIFGETKKTHERDDDMRIHESGEVIVLIITKIAGLVLFGIIATSSVVFDIQGDVVSIVYKSVVKLMQMLVSIYFGNISGVEFVRGEVINQTRKRVSYVQQFLDRNPIGGTIGEQKENHNIQ